MFKQQLRCVRSLVNYLPFVFTKAVNKNNCFCSLEKCFSVGNASDIWNRPTTKGYVCPTISVRTYAKGKDKKKTSKGKKIEVNEKELAEAVDVDKLYASLQKPITHMKEEYVNQLTLRTTTGSLDLLHIVHNGQEYVLQDLAEISKVNPKTYVVSLSTFPQAIPDVLKAIQKSGLNLNPQQDGTTLYIPVPKVTKEHREHLAKSAKAMFIKCRDAIREVQNQTLKSLKDKENISEDSYFRLKDQITTLADHRISEAESLLKTKQTELVGTT